jgi:hypothetical protein
MNAGSSTIDSLRARRELRAEIARHRRRINAGVVQLEREGRKVVSWRTHAARHPLAALGGAFGLGVAISAGLPRRGWWRWLAMMAFRNAFAGLPSMFLHEALAAVMNVAQSARKR